MTFPVPVCPPRGWLRAVREESGLTQAEVARRLGTTRQGYAQIEAAEATGSITLKYLQRAAAALGAELVYFVAPRRAGIQPRDQGRHLRPARQLTRPQDVSQRPSGKAQPGQAARPMLSARTEDITELPHHLR